MFVIVVAWNGAELIQRCLESLLNQHNLREHTVCVVDNASTDNTLQVVRELSSRFKEKGISFELIQSQDNLGYTGGANLGLRSVLERGAGDEDLAVVLNQDVEVHSGWVDALQEVSERIPDLGAVGCLALYPDGELIQHAGAKLEMPRMVAHHIAYHQRNVPLNEQEVDFVSGMAIGLKIGALRKVGLFDEVFSPGYYEDAEICVRMRRHGFRVVFSPRARVTHLETQSFSDLRHRLVLSHRNRIIFALNYFEGQAIDSFFDAESQYISADAHPDECVMLASAYLLALAHLSRQEPSLLSKYPVNSYRRRRLLELRKQCIRKALAL